MNFDDEEPLPSRRHADGAVMSFTEIARELGISRERARQLYGSAMRKLRSSPYLPILRELAAELESSRHGVIE